MIVDTLVSLLEKFEHYQQVNVQVEGEQVPRRIKKVVGIREFDLSAERPPESGSCYITLVVEK